MISIHQRQTLTSAGKKSELDKENMLQVVPTNSLTKMFPTEMWLVQVIAHTCHRHLKGLYWSGYQIRSEE